jgi:hypothetical protein
VKELLMTLEKEVLTGRGVLGVYDRPCQAGRARAPQRRKTRGLSSI